MWRPMVLPVPQRPRTPAPKTLQAPESKKEMRRTIVAATELPFVCCRCKHFTRACDKYTHGDWALWHLRRHGKDRRLLEGLWSQAAFPCSCDLEDQIAREEALAAESMATAERLANSA